MSRAAYEALVAESARTGLPEAFQADLTEHDRRRLEGAEAPEQFAWVLRKSGTLLLDASMPAAARDAYAEHLTRSGRCEGDRFYFWDGVSLVHCWDARTMIARMRPHAANGPSTY